MAVSNSSLDDLLKEATSNLQAVGIDNPQLDARLLLEFVSGLTHSAIIAAGQKCLDETVVNHFQDCIEQRMKAKPVHRIIGYREFYGRDFKLNAATLEPRPDTETLIERVLADYPDRKRNVCFADIGTGTGAIAITLLCELQNAHCLATDISHAALKMAKANAETHNVGKRITFKTANYLDTILGPFDFIASNPPYITSEVVQTLSDEVKNHDPLRALDGGDDGLDAYRSLLRDANELLKPEGRLYLEIGFDQANPVKQMCQQMNWRWIDLSSDLAGNPRVIVLGKQ